MKIYIYILININISYHLFFKLENYFELEKIEPSRKNYQEYIQNLLQKDNQEFLLRENSSLAQFIL